MLNKISIFLLLLFLYSFGQEHDRVVAKVGNYEISESEFKERFDFSIHPGLLQKGNRDSIKLDFLKQLIAEKLLSQEARNKGFDTLSVFNDILTPLENIYIRDMLYQLEIKNKVSVTPDEIRTGLKRIKKVLSLQFIYSKDLIELQLIHKKLISGASFDSLLRTRTESKDQYVPREITFGTMDKSIEDSVYNLRIGEFTQPLASQDGYYILKLIDIRNNIQNKSEQTLAEDVRKILFTRNEFRLYLNFYRSFFSPHKITAEREIFEELIPRFLENFQKKYSQPDSSGKIVLMGSEVTSASQGFGKELIHKRFMDVNGKDIKINYFLNQLSHEGLSVREINEESVRASLSSYIRKFIEDELLSAEGRELGFGEHKDIKRYMRMWSDSYLSKMLMLNIFDSLKTTQADFKDYEKNYSEEVNIAEVLTDSLSIMEKVINELSKGKDIRDLARRYSIRDSLRSRGGESGFFPITKNGELGKLAAQMNIGDIYGPIRLDEGYSIFKLIERRVDSSSTENILPELREQFIMRSALDKFENYVNIYNSNLAHKYGVKINEDVLKNIDNVFLNLVVVRYMGFGGQIFAVPYTEQFPGWYEVWKNSNSVPEP